ncbi:hypothetical protein [Nocardiopsis algeriensis]|uniref:Uncharacterized protein n=1 Tax=Nocardiopsis algeriensis TaxID=1478215 RepID=A0A841IKF4_9ACTN|nr:hypothetical protein [Nocardiopsis algeriensis]MBB6118444.1 hypothetical protein [Nocardiopsis algeriensis]
MLVDAAALLAHMTRESARACVLVERSEGENPGESVPLRYRISARDLLHWEYTVDEAGATVLRQACDGRELVQDSGRGPLRSPVPGHDTVDDPRYFYSWVGAVDTWLVEMLRPVDLLARVRVTSVAEEPSGTGLRIGALPLGSEPSPYSGFSMPDGRTLDMVLDPGRGLLVRVGIRAADGSLIDYSLTEESGSGTA